MKALATVVGIAAMIGFGGLARSEPPPGAAPAMTTPDNPPTAAGTPAATAAVTVLQDVCLPLIKGAHLNEVAPGAGLKLKDGQWILPIAGKRQIDLRPPDQANPHVCTAIIVHRIGGQSAILQAVNQWAATQTPPLRPIKTQEQSNGSVYQRTTSSWGRQTPSGAEGLVLAAEKTLQGKPVAGDADQSELMVSITPG